MTEKKRQIVLPTGRNVEYGSKSHISYLEKLLANLCHERDRYRRDSSTRSDYSRAVARTKRRLKRAQAYAEKQLAKG